MKKANMSGGIIICGLNGAGKTTLGKALAKELGSYFIDDEQLYFENTDYASPRSYDEAERILFSEIMSHENFVFACVKGDYGDSSCLFFRCVVLVSAPKDIRMRRVRERSYRQFGERILPGGDLYEQEKSFFNFVGSRSEDTVEKWVSSLSCPVIRVDGTAPVEKNIKLISEEIL